MTDFINLISCDDLVIINNSKTIKARLFGARKTGAKIEVLFESALSNQNFIAIAKSNRPLKVNDEIFLDDKKKLTVVKKLEEGKIEFTANEDIEQLLNQFGHIPLPPYIKRLDETIDEKRYQTVYANLGHSIAAPTAGLHFDEKMIESLKQKGVQIIDLCLDVGLGTFKPVQSEKIDEHQMHFENYQISEQSAQAINKKIKDKSGKIIAVGSTSTRAIESNFLTFNQIKAGKYQTNLFIKPNFQFKVIDAILTNFHIPKSTLVIMVASFMGYENWKKAYEVAIKNRYRFFSYGDAMLIEPK